MKGLVIGLVALVAVAGLYFFSWVSKNDQEVRLRQEIVAQQEVCQANFDKMFKVIAQTAQVPQEFMEQSKQAFKEIYQPLIEGRYQDKDGNQKQVLMNWVQESNPQFDMAASAELYKKIQTVVEVQRNEFFTQQKKLIDQHRQHTTFVSTFMNKTLFMLGDRLITTCEGETESGDEFCVRVVKSFNTDNVYKTGQENDISLF